MATLGLRKNPPQRSSVDRIEATELPEIIDATERRNTAARVYGKDHHMTKPFPESFMEDFHKNDNLYRMSAHSQGEQIVEQPRPVIAHTLDER